MGSEEDSAEVTDDKMPVRGQRRLSACLLNALKVVNPETGSGLVNNEMAWEGCHSVTLVTISGTVCSSGVNCFCPLAEMLAFYEHLGEKIPQSLNPLSTTKTSSSFINVFISSV